MNTGISILCSMIGIFGKREEKGGIHKLIIDKQYYEKYYEKYGEREGIQSEEGCGTR